MQTPFNIPAPVANSRLGRYVRAVEAANAELKKQLTMRRPEPQPTQAEASEAFVIFHWHGTDSEYPVGIFTDKEAVEKAVDTLNNGGKDYGFEPLPMNTLPV